MNKIALLTAAINGDNSGDAVIESAVTRLLGMADIKRFPLTSPLNDENFEAINKCDVLLICGTNLYQHVFACNLTRSAIERIKVPIIPFGIGTSAAIGKTARMNQEGIDAVRAIHKKCTVSSVRDEASLRFLHSIGVDNVILTGCPVLFHGLSCPDFTPSGEGYTLTPRARMLHIDDRWNVRQVRALEFLCSRYHPTLVLQSPYDIPIAEMLAKKYNVEILMDDKWQADTYIAKAKNQNMNFGFRLHFAMLSISYGKPAFVVAHDSRVTEFCRLLGLPVFDIRDYTDNELTLHIDSRSFDVNGIRRRWDELSGKMCEFMSANGLETRLKASTSKLVVKHARKLQAIDKPKILMLIDKENWAYDISARQIVRYLKDDFDFDLKYVRDKPKLDLLSYDLIYIFFWGETYYQKYRFEPERVIKEVSSHRWEDAGPYGQCTPTEFVEKYLRDCRTVTCTSLRLFNLLKGHHQRIYHTANGFSPSSFFKIFRKKRTGPLTIGWAGNIDDKVKGYRDILEPACRNRFKLLIAPGNVPHETMNNFYNQIDVYAVTSRHEGEPLTLIEAMAAGCFPVCNDVGIVPELITHGLNGYIVADRTSSAFAEAFSWCEANIMKVRAAGEDNARLMLREREWAVSAQYFKKVFVDIYNEVSKPRFRNDDVSWDTAIKHFVKFCAVFHKNGFKQVHGITLRGKTNTIYKFGITPTEYDGYNPLSKIDNDLIRNLSEAFKFEDRADLIEYLNHVPDEIALHGLYHTDYSKMNYEEQISEIEEGLRILKTLFPNKTIRYFIPPFNRANRFTQKACNKFGLYMLTTSGVHLEAELSCLSIKGNIWYRYHHHRFYPESTFNYYELSIQKLEKALSEPFLPKSESKKLPIIKKILACIRRTLFGHQKLGVCSL